MHCLGNYESDQPWFRGESYPAYCAAWLKTSQPEGFLQMLRDSIKDTRTIAEVCEENNRRVGFLWVSFSEIEGYGLTVAEVNDIEVAPEAQRRGIGSAMIQRAEALAKERGADILRSETGNENAASNALHKKAGFEVFRLQYEKRLES
jgi:ribosomal protein S18 acetylase RimI-like enzyme